MSPARKAPEVAPVAEGYSYQELRPLLAATLGAGRARIVEMMWQIAYTDDVVTEFEDNLIWRAADLLSVSQTERIALRERVAAMYPGATIFPEGLAIGSSFDLDLVEQIYAAAAEEAQAPPPTAAGGAVPPP